MHTVSTIKIVNYYHGDKFTEDFFRRCHAFGFSQVSKGLWHGGFLFLVPIWVCRGCTLGAFCFNMERHHFHIGTKHTGAKSTPGQPLHAKTGLQSYSLVKCVLACPQSC